MLSRLFDRWSRSRGFTSNELAILRLFFPAGSEYSERLFSQAANAPYVERKLTGTNGYEAIIPYVADDSTLIECDANITSPLISLITSSGMAMHFSVTILRGGFVRGLNGQSGEGIAWPKEWTADLNSATIPSGIRNWIPMPITEEARNRVLNQLLLWCDAKPVESTSPSNAEMIRVTEPASIANVRDCEARLQLRLSEQYCQLVSLTNGFGIRRGRPYEFLGTVDLNYVNGGREWLCLTPLYENGCVAIHCNKGIASNECYLLSTDGVSTHIGDIRRHARDSLRWDASGLH